MLNDWYQAVLDIQAAPETTKDLAINVTTRLAEEGIITIYKENTSKTHISGKFAPGPQFQDASGYIASEFNHITLGGMDIHLESWVNEYGIVGLDHAKCPSCGHEFSSHSFEYMAPLKENIVNAGHDFIKTGMQQLISCPACETKNFARLWQTEPHLGFCNLAFTFWNWPPFADWKVNLPEIIANTLNHKIIVTYGRL